ncbi:NAD-dependent epimerase/dehydratase family protein [Mangrovicoccus algicola]|uniref:NAD(P)-dependent oxidoreductase n=1 Tax=Mangrovicoccus algicola TaxID=2771008 RepID=A0A8J7CWP0_9RHOB|nr:NAD(P)-dependent oxidoreductase [Mangrovicoccus algicola]MBE3638007.1 NAD(P)-dependent oxidoreductase [Mangrovicoccus algicola]
MTEPRFDRVLITGAAGRLGTELRRGLAPLARELRLADRAPILELRPNETAMIFDLADEAACHAACAGVDAVVHFGGTPHEAPWAEILDSSIRGSYHIYEGARRAGVRRIVYASSVHAVGFHRLEDHVDAAAPVRPDSLYGVSKCFTEALARLYWDKFGIESACLRIFSSFPEPGDRRNLWSWLSFGDCVRLVEAALTAPRVGHTIAFGMSDNPVKPVDDRLARHLGFVPQDGTAPFRARVEAAVPPGDPAAPSVMYLGGRICAAGHPEDRDEGQL